MPHRSAVAKVVQRDPAVLPDPLALPALTLDRLRGAGLFDTIARALPLSRRGGFTAPAVTAAILTYMLSGVQTGLRPFFETLDLKLRRQLAAAAGLRRIPTAASISRCLHGLTHDAVREGIRGVLTAPVEGLDIFHHPAVHHLDANGGAWHVVDIDPTVKAYRQRDLPEGDGLPPAERRAPGEPGYTGRHRGEIRIRAVPAIHDGTGVWLGLQVLPKEGSILDVTSSLVDDSVRVLGAHNVPTAWVIFRGDGEFGSAAVMEAISKRDAHFLVRISRYKLIHREEVQATLSKARWHPVRPGESGVPRQATDLGYFTLVGSTEGRPQVRVRIVATRIRLRRDEAQDDKTGHGIRMGSYRIELFATSLDAVCWPAPDIAELYMGRSVIENRLAQEDHEFGLGRTFSQNPAGQEWAWGVGLFAWNEQICTGWRLNPPKVTARQQQRRGDDAGEIWDGGAVASSGGRSSIQNPVTRTTTTQTPPSVPVPPEVPKVPTQNASEPAAAEPATTASKAFKLLVRVLARSFKAMEPGWSVDLQMGFVRCPEGQRLKPYNVATPESGRPRLSVRSDANACVGCLRRGACFPADRTGPYKQMTRAISPTEMKACAQAIAEMRPKMPAPRPRPPARLNEGRVQTKDLPGPSYTPPDQSPPGAWWAERPQFVPTEARRRARRLPRGCVVRIEISAILPLERQRSDIARDRARRAHRRRTYAEMEARNRLDDGIGDRLTVGPRGKA